MAWGLNNPSWAGYSKKTQNRCKREIIEQAAAEVAAYERRHGLTAGGLLGDGGTGVALCASVADGPSSPGGVPGSLGSPIEV